MVARTIGLICLSLLASCATAPVFPPGTVFVTADEHAGFKATAAEAARAHVRIKAMEAQLSELKTKLSALMTRTALAAYKPTRLVPMPGGPTLAGLGDVTWIDKPGDRPKKRNLAKVVRSSRATVFSFWATWCVPCISDEELAHLRELKRQLVRFNVNVIPMAIDDLDKVLAHRKASQWLYPLWFKKGGHIEVMPQRFIEQAGMGLPLFAVVNSLGHIHYVYQRKLDHALVNEIVDASLSL